jgi:hypothetical protein
VDHWPGSAVMQTQVRNDTWRPLVLPVVEIHRTGDQMHDGPEATRDEHCLIFCAHVEGGEMITA